ncbi:ATP-binding cassette subfamily B protein/subfamily B ATP-binding cassette protein MsbA [Scopulibacillus darangshiensis]|uniref:ATP-binding cassette subfamily B protein/subfamily B ATP-binding cassette protein MsbA n=1 Tax=Scopulibacillus darangshiensis TaxID=442528 RepID=A0A4R2P5F3_9BACL|nr:ABC transporter ATP-binding protein [Scopulibacillus darangshiensis]TCP30013.1 ATP-binding cassette subfamily B protein/subfamily B ATP-binding cassette protein MsbA [Scopulibacillus darangshiensis]
MKLAFSVACKFKGILLLEILVLIIIAMLEALFPYLNKLLIDDVFGEKEFDLLIKLFFVIIFSAILLSLLNILLSYCVSFISGKIEIYIKCNLFNRIRKLPFSFYDNNSEGAILSIFQNDVFLFVSIFREIYPSIIHITLRIIVSVSIMTFISWKLFLMGLFFFPLSYLLMIIFSKKVKKQSNTNQENIAIVNERLREAIFLTPEIFAFSQEEWDKTRLKKVFKIPFMSQIKLSMYSSLNSNIIIFLYWFTFGVLFLYGGLLVERNALTLGLLIASINYMMNLFSPISHITVIANQLQAALGGSEKIFNLLYGNNHSEEVKKKQLSSIDTIKFVNVSLEKTKDKKIILNKVNMNFNKGKIYAITGESGAGKTTLVKLLLNFIEPSKGSILINDHENINFREKISLVFQHTNLLSDSIDSNLRFGNYHIDQNRINNAAQKAYIHKLILSLPMKYNTHIGNNGQMLSGGQRQRLSIARALLKEHDVLILDEGTSSLDHVSEKNVLNNILNEDYKKDKIIILITHNINNMKMADYIYVLKEGKVVEEGPFDSIKYCNSELVTSN